jgi:hypothetical protein
LFFCACQTEQKNIDKGAVKVTFWQHNYIEGRETAQNKGMRDPIILKGVAEERVSESQVAY